MKITNLTVSIPNNNHPANNGRPSARPALRQTFYACIACCSLLGGYASAQIVHAGAYTPSITFSASNPQVGVNQSISYVLFGAPTVTADGTASLGVQLHAQSQAKGFIPD